MKNDIDKAVEWAEREKRHKLNLIYDHKNTKCAETWEDEISHLKTLIQAALQGVGATSYTRDEARSWCSDEKALGFIEDNPHGIRIIPQTEKE